MVPVMPHYYRSGVSLLSRKENNIQYWEDLRNQRICAEHGAFYNRIVMLRFGVDIIRLYSRELATAALLDGRCVGLLYMEESENSSLKTTKWVQDFTIPLEKLSVSPWFIYVSLKDKDSRLEKWISETVANWHREGLIIALEKKWGVSESFYSTSMNKIWNKKINNEFFCTTPINKQTPLECIK